MVHSTPWPVSFELPGIMDTVWTGPQRFTVLAYWICRNGVDVTETSKLLKEALQVESHHLVTKPLFNTPINLVNRILAPKMKENWMDHVSQGQATIVNNIILDDSPMYRSNETLYMEWKYDAWRDHAMNNQSASPLAKSGSIARVQMEY
jgi:hypothetical protein